MNTLVVGSAKDAILRHIPEGDFLIIDDGSVIDKLRLPRASYFDIERHTFDPLSDMSYRRACDFVDVLNAVFPAGENTLTKSIASNQLLEALMEKPTKLDRIIKDTKDTRYAYQMIQRVLLSPVLSRVLKKPDFPFEGTVIVRIDRAELGDFDAYVLGNLIVSQYRGQVVITDFGFYAHQGHSALIEQHRLTAGVRFLDQVPELRSELLLMQEKVAAHPIPDDAEILAVFAGHQRGTEGFASFVQLALA